MKSRTLRGLVTAALAGMLLAAAPAAAAGAAVKPATAMLSASPDTNLVDGQTVTVTATGYPANHTADLVECEQSVGCDFSTLFVVGLDADGGYTTTFNVHRILQLDGVQADCVALQDCILVSLDISDLSTGAQTPITFDPNAPFKPPLHFRVVPDANARVQVDKGVVRVTGRVFCNQPVDISAQMTLTQQYNRQIFQTLAFPDLPCARGGSVFSVVFRPNNGLFGAGAAKLRIDAFGSTTSSYEQHKALMLNLVPTS